ncbi:MAG: 3-ketoacyl-ACP reductase [Lentisphaerae bacterium]|nr:3-ketoacyl-ACP reductase [Lentisphaerota bacterium]
MSDKPVALVTGSGRGIGRAIAERLAADGFAVAVNAVTVDTANLDDGAFSVKTGIERAGGTAELFQADISEPARRRAMVDAVAERFGRIDLLVNNAGVGPAERKDLLEASEESFERLIRINLQGPYFLTQQVARRMIRWQAEGIVPQPRIAFISSISAYTSSPNRGDYCVSKAGLNMAGRLFADRLGEFGIPVITLCPGIIETRMTRGVKEKYDRLIADGLLVTRRWGRPEDVAGVVASFARGDLDYCTGETIEVGGGLGLRRL